MELQHCYHLHNVHLAEIDVIKDIVLLNVSYCLMKSIISYVINMIYKILVFVLRVPRYAFLIRSFLD